MELSKVDNAQIVRYSTVDAAIKPIPKDEPKPPATAHRRHRLRAKAKAKPAPQFMELSKVDNAKVLRYPSVDAALKSLKAPAPKAKPVRATVPEATRALGPDAKRAHLRGLDWSHKKAHSAGGSSSARNGVFEDASRNRARGAAPMTRAELKAAQSNMANKAVKGWAGRIGGSAIGGAVLGPAVTAAYLAAKHYVAYESGCVSSDQAVDGFKSDAKYMLPSAAVVGGSGGALAKEYPQIRQIGVFESVDAALAYDVFSDIREWRVPPVLAGGDGLYAELSGYLPLLEQNCASGSITVAQQESIDNPAHWFFVVDEAGRAFTLHRDVWRVGSEMAVGPHRIMRGWEKAPRLGED